MIVKKFFLNMIIKFKWTCGVFLVFNFIIALVYLCLGYGYENQNIVFSFVFTFIHTLIATFTLTIPKFIDETAMLGSNLYLDLLVLGHMIVAYIFVGILVSSIFRWATRSL